MKTHLNIQAGGTCAVKRAKAFTLIQLIGTICIIVGIVSIIMVSLKAVSDRADAASKSQQKMLAPALEQIAGAVTNHNNMARQADQAMQAIK